jgi:trans-2,3-dihydro-3-hydroxyanthranilate isomerase
MPRRFVTLDVFTARRFAGNPLAVVLDAEGLDTATMQAVARELNLSETVFVLPAEEARSRARLRIFTPGAELPFAGHPTVGTAILLRLLDGGDGEREMILEEGVGPVTCVAKAGADRSGWARFDLPREPEQIDDSHDAGHIAEALGLTLDDLGCGDFLPGVWTAGNPFTMVPLRGRDAVARSRPDPTRWDATFGPDDPKGVFVFCREAVEGHDFHARMFAPGLGVAEDPATGSAAAAFAGMLARFGGLADGRHTIAIEQGYEMGRPSVIHLHVVIRNAQLVEAAIGGEAVVVTEGAIVA